MCLPAKNLKTGTINGKYGVLFNWEKQMCKLRLDG
jgi:hypothetical protein